MEWGRQAAIKKTFRHFLRLDKPLCCLNLDDDDNSSTVVNDDNSGGPMPIHRYSTILFCSKANSF